jgi:FAD/FMN-containing dehydrogenase
MQATFDAQLRAIVGDDGWISPEAIAERGRGPWGASFQAARALLRPRTTAEVAAILRACHAVRQSVVTHGGLTGLGRGTDAVASEVVISLDRMVAIENVDTTGLTATVEAGVTLRTLQDALEPYRLVFPLDLGSRDHATIGGNIATNAGGTRVLRYGMMRDMVLGLEAVLADGTVLSGLNLVIKNNTGYDLKQLFIGSEGTLGIVTRAVLRLRAMPASCDVALLAVSDFSDVLVLLKLADRGLGGHLSAFEVMWRDHYDFVTTPPARSTSPIAKGRAHYVLVEAQGSDPEADAAQFANVIAQARARGVIADAVIARSAAEQKAIWAIRDDVGELRRLGPLCVFDVGLPLASMEAYVEEVCSALARYWPGAHCSVFGHVADGNLHFIFAPGAGDHATRQAVDEIVYRPLAALRGAISAEHGIGFEKKPYLAISRTPEEIALMRLLKRTLDPNAVLNRGRVVDV